MLGLLDPHATSPFGKRRLRQWLCTPLYRPEDIADRVAAVEELMPLLDGPVAAAKAALKGLPDVERLLARIHTLGSKVAAQDHPDAQAIMYEMETYGKRKIADLLAALKAFRAIAAVRAAFHGAEGDGELHEGLACPLLRRVLHEGFPDLAPQLAFFASAFDAKQAEKDGRIKPAPGVDAAFDGALAAIKDIEGQLAEYLREQKKALRCDALAYWGTGKDRFQIEVPEAVSSRVPDDFTLKSRRKGSGKTGGVVRYWTPEVERLLAELVAAEERREAAVKDSLRRIFHRFDAHRAAWQAAVNCAAVLDCLIALATWSARGDGGGMCKPTILPPASAAADGEPILHLEEARHPCMVVSQIAASCSGAGAGAGAGDDEGGSSGIASVVAGAAMVIPNDLFMGRPQAAAGDASSADAGAGAGMAEDGIDGYGAAAAPGAPCVLVTGPNMGGKSTLLRQACLSVILAQLGAYVPASRMTLSPVDRIFTRVGASDRILAGQSTFYVELAETSAILHQATKASLVILDELGRGTSTFDGNAIAYAVTRHMVDVVGCRTLFATHYHTLTDDFAAHPGVALGHMGCLVEERPDGTSSVTFLYKYQDGACPKSYGLNVARLAHLPESVILRAKAKSEEFEAAVEAAKRGELRLASSPTAGASAGAGAGSSGGSEGIGADSDADAWAAFYDAADSFSAGGTEIAAAALVSTARRLRGLAE